ncbi:hypothetical protein BC628DRAFT_469211 [Trametes gibbosa]|nr:hypothetical protein BC628DRAFT_469211 [Trametes gibbosa]
MLGIQEKGRRRGGGYGGCGGRRGGWNADGILYIRQRTLASSGGRLGHGPESRRDRRSPLLVAVPVVVHRTSADAFALSRRHAARCPQCCPHRPLAGSQISDLMPVRNIYTHCPGLHSSAVKSSDQKQDAEWSEDPARSRHTRPCHRSLALAARRVACPSHAKPNLVTPPRAPQSSLAGRTTPIQGHCARAWRHRLRYVSCHRIQPHPHHSASSSLADDTRNNRVLRSGSQADEIPNSLFAPASPAPHPPASPHSPPNRDSYRPYRAHPCGFVQSVPGQLQRAGPT